MNYVDTHTHIYLGEFDEDRSEVIERAVKKGVTKMFLPNIDSSSIPALFKTAEQFPGTCFPMMGLHPCSVQARYADELKVVEHWIAKKKFYAIGEIGIDLYWDKTFFDQQVDAFRHQVKLAKKSKLPVIIHTRNSFEEAFSVIREEHSSDLRGIFHCFSGNVEQAKRVAALGGFKMGIGGVLTFKNSGLDKVVKEVPLEHFVLETDAPYLAPVPHRGQRNEPSYIPEIAAFFASLLGIPVEELAERTAFSSEEIFGV